MNVQMETNVQYVKKTELKNHQTVHAQMVNMKTPKESVLTVLTNVLNVQEPLMFVTNVTMSENQNQLVNVQMVSSTLKEHQNVEFVKSNVKLVLEIPPPV
jgi:hypothetical protein